MSTDHHATAPEPMLTHLEARLIACLMEKQRTTPDQYPLTLNALVTACNQKTARDPIMNLTPGEVGHAVNILRDRGLIHVSFTGRTERYDHKLVGTFFLSREEQALLCVLMLRGPQSVGELRLNAARLAEFRDLNQVSDTLRAMAERDRPLVLELPLELGKREKRYAHLLSGQPSLTPRSTPTSTPARRSSGEDERIAALEAEIAALRARVDELWAAHSRQDQS